jgi:hypothetical protein
VRLFVKKARSVDVYGDVARIHESQRGGIFAGSICIIRAFSEDRSEIGRHYVVVRGIDADNEPWKRGWILLDETARERLGVAADKTYDFSIVRLRGPLSICWAWHSSNPSTRIATHWTIISLILGGLIGWLLGKI